MALKHRKVNYTTFTTTTRAGCIKPQPSAEKYSEQRCTTRPATFHPTRNERVTNRSIHATHQML